MAAAARVHDGADHGGAKCHGQYRGVAYHGVVILDRAWGGDSCGPDGQGPDAPYPHAHCCAEIARAHRENARESPQAHAQKAAPVNLPDTQSARPPAVRRGGQQVGHTWDFADVQRLRSRPTLYSDGVLGLYPAVIENALSECRRFGTFGFQHDAVSRRGEAERQAYAHLILWLRGAPAHVTLHQCCDVLGLTADYVGPGMILIAQRLGSSGPMPARACTTRRYISRGMRVRQA